MDMAMETVVIRKQLQDNKEMPDWFWIEMYDDSKLVEEKCEYKSVRIGSEYQVIID